MSLWTERVANSGVWVQLQALGPAIDQALTREGIESASIDGLERLRTVLAFAGKRLASLDPALVLPAPLEGIANSLQAATAELQAFIADGSSGHVVNANSHADTALSNLAGLVGYAQPSEFEALSSASLNYRASMQTAVNMAQATATKFAADVDAQRAKLVELTAEMAAERQRLSSLVSDFQAQFSAAQESRVAEYSAAQNARQERFAALIDDYTTRLTQHEAEVVKALAAAQTSFQAGLDQLTASYSAKAEVLLAEIQRHRQDVEKLVGVIGNLGVTSGYLKTANRAEKSLWFWQAITVLAMGGLIVVAYREFVPMVNAPFSWAGFASRLVLTLTVGVLAAYAGSQADKFLKIERRNRKLALELEAIGPFLAPLPQEKQEQFRLDVGARSFGGDGGEDGVAARSPATVLDVLAKSKDARDLITDIVKAARAP